MERAFCFIPLRRFELAKPVRIWGAMGAPPVAEASDQSEWQRSARDEGDLSPRTFAGYRNRARAALPVADAAAPLVCSGR